MNQEIDQGSSHGTASASDLSNGTTGSGAVVLATSPALVTPVLGAASATSINFGGTTLSTYVEGTFTPALKFGGASVGMTGTFLGRYTQIGNMVMINIDIILSAKGSSTGTATITGLPVAATSTANRFQSAYIEMWNGTITGQLVAHIDPASPSQIGLDIINNGAAALAAETNFGNVTQLMFNMMYFTN